MKTIKKFKTPEDEVDSWKLKVYEETKDMTSEQYVAHTKRSVKAFLKECGYKLVKNPDNHTMRLVKTNKIANA